MYHITHIIARLLYKQQVVRNIGGCVKISTSTSNT